MHLMFGLCALRSDDDDEDTMQVDWEWGTVRYKTSNYNPPARTPSAAAQPPHQSAVIQRTSQLARAAAAGTRGDPVNGVTHVSKPNKHISQPVGSTRVVSE